MRVLFVCLGNICRSPAAEAQMRHLLDAHAVEGWTLDSAGTSNYHEGEPSDARMRKAAAARGIRITSRARGIRDQDFRDFDYILTMDEANYKDTSERRALVSGATAIVEPMCQYVVRSNVTEVPDPYFGGDEGFELVLDILDDACKGFLAQRGIMIT